MCRQLARARVEDKSEWPQPVVATCLREERRTVGAATAPREIALAGAIREYRGADLVWSSSGAQPLTRACEISRDLHGDSGGGSTYHATVVSAGIDRVSKRFSDFQNVIISPSATSLNGMLLPFITILAWSARLKLNVQTGFPEASNISPVMNFG